MENILDKILHYSLYINWVNLFIFIMFFLVLWNWITYFTNFHKRANGIIEHYIRILLPIPFWVVFFIYNFNFLSPLDFYNNENSLTKEIIIDNNTSKDLKLQFIALNTDLNNNEKRHLFNNFENYLSKNYTINKNKRETITFEIDNSKYRNLQIIKIDEDDNLFLYGKTFAINNTKLLIFGDEFGKVPIKPIKFNNSYFYKLFIINFMAILSIWYYYFLAFMKKNKKIFMILASIITLISLSSIFFNVRLLLE